MNIKPALYNFETSYLWSPYKYKKVIFEKEIDELLPFSDAYLQHEQINYVINVWTFFISPSQ